MIFFITRVLEVWSFGTAKSNPLRKVYQKAGIYAACRKACLSKVGILGMTHFLAKEIQTHLVSIIIARRMKPEKNITLLAAGIIVLAAFFLLPKNQEWMANRILHYWKDFTVQKNNLDPEHRKTDRYQDAYTWSQKIAGYFKERKIARQVLVLMPPASYFAAHQVTYHVPEPAVFYYFTGLHTVWANSPQAIHASWVVRVNKGNIIIDSVENIQILADSINSYKKFGYQL